MARQIVSIVWNTADERDAIAVATEIFNWANKGLVSVNIKAVKEVADES
jgi:hypothetical protein